MPCQAVSYFFSRALPPQSEVGAKPKSFQFFEKVLDNQKKYCIFAVSEAPRPSHLAKICVGWLTGRLSKQSRSRGDYEIKGDFGLLFFIFSKLKESFLNRPVLWHALSLQSKTFHFYCNLAEQLLHDLDSLRSLLQVTRKKACYQYEFH